MNLQSWEKIFGHYSSGKSLSDWDNGRTEKEKVI